MSIGNIYHSLDWDYYWSLPHPAFRDLAYLLNAPCLLTSCETFDAVETTTVQGWFEQYRDWIQEDALEPRRLLDFVNTPRQYKLGLYAEDLFLHFLEYQTEFELILHDQQIFNDKQCIGSMDFIIVPMVWSNIEMAIKFFLRRCPSTDWIDFVGPSHVDSMHRKLTKMVGRQLKLSQRPEAIEYFDANDIPVPTVHRVFSVGRFFKGYGMDFVAPEGCDPNQPTGQWIRRRDFIVLFEAPNLGCAPQLDWPLFNNRCIGIAFGGYCITYPNGTRQVLDAVSNAASPSRVAGMCSMGLGRRRLG